MSREEDGSRADRLRRRRSSRPVRSPDEPSEPAKRDEPTEPSKPSQPDEPSNQSERSPSATASVKEEQVGTYMYLPEPQKKEVERLYSVLKADYEYEFDEEFEKNRHFFPILIQHGLDGLDGLDASDVREHLEGL